MDQWIVGLEYVLGLVNEIGERVGDLTASAEELVALQEAAITAERFLVEYREMRERLIHILVDHDKMGLEGAGQKARELRAIMACEPPDLSIEREALDVALRRQVQRS